MGSGQVSDFELIFREYELLLYDSGKSHIF